MKINSVKEALINELMSAIARVRNSDEIQSYSLSMITTREQGCDVDPQGNVYDNVRCLYFSRVGYMDGVDMDNHFTSLAEQSIRPTADIMEAKFKYDFVQTGLPSEIASMLAKAKRSIIEQDATKEFGAWKGGKSL